MPVAGVTAPTLFARWAHAGCDPASRRVGAAPAGWAATAVPTASTHAVTRMPQRFFIRRLRTRTGQSVTQRGPKSALGGHLVSEVCGQRGTHRNRDHGGTMSSVVGLRLPRGNDTQNSSARPSWFDGWPGLLTVFALAGTCTLLAIALDFRGSDLPAQVFRSELVRRDGFVVWNSQWFGGHSMLSYSVLSPLAGALTGPLAVGAISGVAAAVLFERILRYAYGRTVWLAAIWFALGTVANLIVGRVTFALGVAFAMGAVYALQRRRSVVAIALALLCALSSPLA